MRYFGIFLLILTLISCSHLPFATKGDSSEKKEKKEAAQEVDKRGEKLEKVDESAPKPGDIKVVDGVEYIYASNRRYMYSPYEPEYIWIRKDQYSPRIGEGLLSGGGGMGKKEKEEFEKRMAKLEEELKKKGIAPQIVYPYQFGAFPTMGLMPGMPLINFNYPSPKMRRRVMVLPFTDHSNYKEEGLGELARARLISRLENTGAVICVDPETIKIDGKDLLEPSSMKILNEVYGIQAVIKGGLSDVYTSSSRIEGKDKQETSFAISKIALDIYNTDTGKIIRHLSGRNPISLTREKGDMGTEKAKVKAIDLAIEIIADDILKSILYLDWHARIASIEEGKVYINAGRLSGLEKGNVLEVYSPGEQVIDSKTGMPLGTTKGTYKGELEVTELFGVDACWAQIKKGSSFSPTDLVYLQQ